jgi:hypothetical protein
MIIRELLILQHHERHWYCAKWVSGRGMILKGFDRRLVLQANSPVSFLKLKDGKCYVLEAEYTGPSSKGITRLSFIRRGVLMIRSGYDYSSMFV